MNELFFPCELLREQFQYNISGQAENFQSLYTFNLYDVLAYGEFVDGDNVFKTFHQRTSIYFRNSNAMVFRISYSEFNDMYLRWINRLSLVNIIQSPCLN